MTRWMIGTVVLVSVLAIHPQCNARVTVLQLVDGGTS